MAFASPGVPSWRVAHNRHNGEAPDRQQGLVPTERS